MVLIEAFQLNRRSRWQLSSQAFLQFSFRKSRRPKISVNSREVVRLVISESSPHVHATLQGACGRIHSLARVMRTETLQIRTMPSFVRKQSLINVVLQRRRAVQQKRWAAISVQVSDARLYDELTGLSSSRLGRSGNALA